MWGLSLQDGDVFVDTAELADCLQDRNHGFDKITPGPRECYDLIWVALWYGRMYSLDLQSS